jgi:hypothetical protein
MAYFSTAPAPGHRNLTAKNRVWDFFQLSSKTHPANRRQPAQPRRKTRPTPTKNVSGIPYWPARDPIGERGGGNLYGFIKNTQVNRIDLLGLVWHSLPGGGGHLDPDDYNPPRRPKPTPAMIDAVKSICDKYPIPAPKCCRNDKMIDDTYPERAIPMCKQFVDLYSDTLDNLETVQCVAKCLSGSESRIQEAKSCAERNAERFEAHIACYANCSFFLDRSRGDNGVPIRGWEIGAKELFPDWFNQRIPSVITGPIPIPW